MVPEDKFEILNAAAKRAARKFNKDPEMREECYEYVLYHAALKISEEHNANYMRMRCDSLARNWYNDEYNRHAKRAEYGIDPDELPFTRTENNRHMTPEEQIIYREEIEGIYRLFAELGLSDFEMKVITTRAEGFITARQIAEVENVNFSRVVRCCRYAHEKNLYRCCVKRQSPRDTTQTDNLLPAWDTAAKTKARTSAQTTTIQTAKEKTKLLQAHRQGKPFQCGCCFLNRNRSSTHLLKMVVGKTAPAGV